jgi:hypothetical protein
VKLIPLSRGLHAKVDDEDYEWLMQWKWHAQCPGPHRGSVIYAGRRGDKSCGKVRLIRMHMLLTGYARTDHIDGDGLNNQRNNLREVSHAQNLANTLKSHGGTSRYKGVSWHSSHGKWQSSVERRVGGLRQRWQRHFVIEIEAALARDEKTREWFGEFGVYNFPRPGERSALTGEVMPQWTSPSTGSKFLPGA